MASPINRIPPEILVLLPDFWDAYNKDKNIITLTHVCWVWRQVFTSRSSLWTRIDCEDKDKTRVYLERSRSSPIDLSLRRDDDLSLHDPFFQITPHTMGRLRSLSVKATMWNLSDIATHLSYPAPLLERMSIDGDYEHDSNGIPTLTSALFGGDLPSLRNLHLEYVCTELPWRNMVNLTSLKLIDTSPVSMSQLLDFFETAPHLYEVEFRMRIPTSGAQDGRLVSLARLESMSIDGGPSSALLDHLLIPVRARLRVEVVLPNPLIEDHPGFLDNLRNLLGFTTIQLNDGPIPRMEFSGPNGEVMMTLATSPDDETFPLRFLTLFGTSETERLEIYFRGSPSSYHPYNTLLRMKNLHTLKLYHCESPDVFVHALDPRNGSLGVVVCPKLEELVIKHEKALDIESVIGMVAARESRGAKIKTIWIISQQGGGNHTQSDMLELKKHVFRLEWIQR